MTHADESFTLDPESIRDQHVHRARRADVRELLETPEALGHVGEIDAVTFVIGGSPVRRYGPRGERV